MKIYTTRHKAEQDRLYSEVIVKVDDGQGGTGYTIMSAQDYQIWKKQK